MENQPSVFISYNHSSAPLVSELVKRLKGIADVHWDKNVGPWESFTDFMNTIRKQDYAVLIVSDLYLRSVACLYEVTQLMSISDWDKKSLFIVEDSARPIFKPSGWIEYIEYWDEQVKDFEDKISDHTDVEALQVELEKLKAIRRNIANFLQKVADANNPEVWKAIEMVVERLKIAGKKNTAEDLESTIIDLILAGQNTTKALMIATNRSQSSIARYIKKLKDEGKIQAIGSRSQQRLTVNT